MTTLNRTTAVTTPRSVPSTPAPSAPRTPNTVRAPVGYSQQSSFEPAPPKNQSCGGPTGSGPGYDGQNLSQAQVFAETDKAAAQYDLPPEVMRAIALQESDATQWYASGNPVRNDNTNGTTDWGVMQLNTEGWLGSGLDVSRAQTDERYNIQMGAKELRVASDYWFNKKYGHPFSMDWYRSLPADQQKEARIDLFRSYNGWLSDTSNATPYENKIESGATGNVSGSTPGSSPNNGSSSNVPSANLTRGDSGPEVEQLQRDLVKLGYLSQADMDTGPGIYGPRTQAAVAGLQRKYGISDDGSSYGPLTRAALTKALAAAQPKPKSPSPSAGTATLVAPPAGLKVGQTSDAVKQLQTTLVGLGYMSQADMNTGPGIYGPHTQAALAGFLHDNGYPDAGGSGYGAKSQAALQKAIDRVKAVPAAGIHRGDEGANVKALQTELVKLGYLTQADMDTGPGTFGPHTQDALRRFQNDHGYPTADGTGYGSKTRAAMIHALAANQKAGVVTGPRGAITTVSQANQYFTNQWAGFSQYNTETSEDYGYSDCGPTSTLMIASSLGLTAPPSPGTAEDQIDHVRDLALGYDSTYSQGTNEGQMANAISAMGGSSQYLDMSLSQVDQAIASGQRVLIAGDPWGAWGANMDANGQYLNHRDPGAHFVAVLGKTADGQYLVADPLSGVGAIAVSGAQIQEFWNEGGGESGAMAVGR